METSLAMKGKCESPCLCTMEGNCVAAIISGVRDTTHMTESAGVYEDDRCAKVDEWVDPLRIWHCEDSRDTKSVILRQL